MAELFMEWMEFLTIEPHIAKFIIQLRGARLFHVGGSKKLLLFKSLVKKSIPSKYPKNITGFSSHKGSHFQASCRLVWIDHVHYKLPYKHSFFLLESSNLLQSSFNGFIVITCEVERQAT
jgi:hypothetical protein